MVDKSIRLLLLVSAKETISELRTEWEECGEKSPI